MWPFHSRGARPSAPNLPAPTPPSPNTAGRDWASLPPIEGVLGPMQRSIEPESFQRGLAVQQPPHPFLGPLGHAISGEAPSGTVAGLITTAAQSTSAAPELTHRTHAKAAPSVQRRPGPGMAGNHVPIEQPRETLAGDLPSADEAPATSEADPLDEGASAPTTDLSFGVPSSAASSPDSIELPRLHLA